MRMEERVENERRRELNPVLKGELDFKKKLENVHSWCGRDLINLCDGFFWIWGEGSEEGGTGG